MHKLVPFVDCINSLNRELPPKDMCLYSPTTKESLVKLISGELCEQFTINASSKSLVITSKSEDSRGDSSLRQNQKTRLDFIL